MAEIIAITNQKGGVGKTTTAVNMAALLQQKGKTVLLVDLDPQASATDTYGAQTEDVETVYDLLVNKDNSPELIQHTTQGDIIAGDILLASADKQLSGVEAPYLLKEYLATVKDKYDYIILDTPPSLNILMTNALTAADSIIIPVCADRYSIKGLHQLFETVRTARNYTNPALKIDGILIVKFQARTNLAGQFVEAISALAANIGTKVYKTHIRESVKVREAQALQMGLYEHAAGSTTAEDYSAFINEYMGGN